MKTSSFRNENDTEVYQAYKRQDFIQYMQLLLLRLEISHIKLEFFRRINEEMYLFEFSAGNLSSIGIPWCIQKEIR